jgi:hypothetical protein
MAHPGESRRIIVHSLTHARAALSAAAKLNVPITLASAAGAGCYAGPLWFKALIEAALAERPDVTATAILDCAEEAGSVLAALRAGLKRVRFAGEEAVRARLADIAAAQGAVIEGDAAEDQLDLLDQPDPEAAALAFLARNKAAP